MADRIVDSVPRGQCRILQIDGATVVDLDTALDMPVASTNALTLPLVRIKFALCEGFIPARSIATQQTTRQFDFKEGQGLPVRRA